MEKVYIIEYSTDRDGKFCIIQFFAKVELRYLIWLVYGHTHMINKQQKEEILCQKQ